MFPAAAAAVVVVPPLGSASSSSPPLSLPLPVLPPPPPAAALVPPQLPAPQPQQQQTESGLMVVDTGKKRKCLLPYENLFLDETLFQGEVTKGAWHAHEEQLLLHIMYCFIMMHNSRS